MHRVAVSTRSPGSPVAPRAGLAVAVVLALAASLLALPVSAGEPTGTVTVEKFDAETLMPLADACFVLITEETGEPQGGEVCTDATGTAVFQGVAEGDYVLVETTPPPGYAPAEPQPVSVTAAEPNPTVEVPNFPPQGVLEIDKFDCTGAETASLQIFENPQEPPEGFLDLDECAIGQATFTVVGGDMPQAVNLETNIFGFTFTELDPGDYQLYETTPNQVGPVAFTIDENDFIFVAAINPLELAPGPPGPQGPPGPAGPAGPRGGGQLPDTPTPPLTPTPPPWALIA
ncbi:MAG TPA: SpaA isopeptide-forming pilin-related protein, partial [Candidatus Limnocylindria bacterium]|nr:SpaA isopeptide-forming pilin-related protein [Candidatus Limnocylindria bacterium]